MLNVDLAKSPRVGLKLLRVGSCRHSERITMRGGTLAAATFPALVALILHPKEGPILWDTGYSPYFDQATRAFPERLYRWVTPVSLPHDQTLEVQLRQHGLSRRDIRLCLISHFHADHIAGLRDLPAARFVAMRGDYQQIATSGRWRGLLHGQLKELLPPDFDARLTFAESLATTALRGPWSRFSHGFDVLGDASILAVHLPGHSAGQMGVLVRDENDRQVFLCADSCWSARAFRELRFPALAARPLMHDWADYKNTIVNLHHLSLEDPHLVILPSHCESSIAAYENSMPRVEVETRTFKVPGAAT
jgi:glyoxylase-like metal-dependent hydrolase (beta-lactamase superfamily II)